jgi:hypothetical protein
MVIYIFQMILSFMDNFLMTKLKDMDNIINEEK